MEKHCLIAGLHIIIDSQDVDLLSMMARRYAPFAHEAGTCTNIPILFKLSHVDRFDSLIGAKQMCRFECEGSDCIFEQTEDKVSITLARPGSDMPIAQMQCDDKFHEAKCWLSGNVGCREYCINNFLMMTFAFASMDKQTLLFHASVTSYQGKAYLFLGKSGTGKSTHSQLWIKNIPGCELVNDDNPVVGIRNGEVVVYGTPWSGKTPCYRNIQYQVGAFVRLHQEKWNRAEKESPIVAFTSLLPSCSGVKWDVRLYRAQCDTISSIIESVNVFNLGCLPDADAAFTCRDAVVYGNCSDSK